MMRGRNMTAIMAATALAMICLSVGADDSVLVVKISAKRFEYNPQKITLKKGRPVVLQLTTEDRLHGFNVPGLNLRTDSKPG